MGPKIKLLILANHTAAIAGLVFGNLYMLAFSMVGLLLINKVGGEIALHRYFCHRSFKTTRTRHYMLLALSCLNCFGPPMAWVGVHRKHHHHSDGEGDPHGAQPMWRVWSTFWKPFTVEKRYIGDMLREPEQVFVYKWYFPLVLGVYGVLALVDWQLPVFLISIPSVISFHLAGLVNTMCHSSGDRDFDTDDNSYNNRWVNLLTLGSGLHNTHHAHPNRWDNRTRKGDIDLPAWIIDRFLMVGDRTQ